MKIQNITYNNTLKPAFKKYISYEDYYDDYGTYYNQISIKDAIISSSILSGILFLVGSIFTNKDYILGFINKTKENAISILKK